MKSTRIYILSAPNAKAIKTLGLLSQMLLTIWLLSEMLLRKSRRRLFNFAVLHLQGRLCRAAVLPISRVGHEGCRLCNPACSKICQSLQAHMLESRPRSSGEPPSIGPKLTCLTRSFDGHLETVKTHIIAALVALCFALKAAEPKVSILHRSATC